MRAAIYARYSSERQKATSIEDQIKLCRDAASQFGCTVLENHIHTDLEISGTVEQRPAYTRLLAAAKAKEFEAILVESQDRLWRDQGEMHYAMKRLRFWGVKVLSVSTGTDLTDDAGKLMASVLGWKDEVFIEDLRKKTRRGMQGQIRRGFSAGGRAYGYRSEPVQDGNGQIIGHRRVIDPAEAKVVRRIFRLYAKGHSPKTIAHMLNAEHALPPRPARGKKLLGWTWTSIAGSSRKAFGILHNPIYVGRMVWNRSIKVRDPDTGKRVMRIRPQDDWVTEDAPQLRIVLDDLWEAVQSRRQSQQQQAKGNLWGRKSKYLFSGLLVCAECGSRYVLKTGDYYGCSAHSNRGPSICPNGRMVRRGPLEKTLLRMIYEEVFSPEVVALIARRLNKRIQQMSESPSAALKRKEVELAKVRGELENIKEAIRQGIITPSTKTMLEEAERRVSDLEAEMKAPPKRVVGLLPGLVSARLQELQRLIGKDNDRARTVLAQLLGQITLRRDGKRLLAELRGNLPGILTLDHYDKGGAGRGI